MRTSLPLLASLLLLPLSHAADDAAQEEPEPLPAAWTALAADMQAAMDLDVDPCDDFYAHACGGWIEATPLPADRPTVTRSFTTIHDANLEILRDVLESSGGQLGSFWAACNDEAAIDALGAAPLDPLRAEIDALRKADGLPDLLGRLHAKGLGGLFGMWIDADPKDPQTAIVHVVQGRGGLPDRGYYLDADKAEDLEAYRAHVTDMLVRLGDKEKKAAKQADAIVAFETRLAEAMWERTVLRDSDLTHNPLDKDGLQALTPNFDWGAYFAARGRPELTRINVMTPDYFEALDRIVTETKVSTLRSYLEWTLLRVTATDLASSFEDANFAFYGTRLYGQQEQRPRWERCVDMADGSLGDLLAQAWVERAFSGEAKPIAVDMISDIEAAFEQGLPDLDWMDDETRTAAVGKARAITNKIGYPDRWLAYPFGVGPDDHFGNQLRAAAHDAAYQLAKAEAPVDPLEWYMTAPTVNAYYNPPANEIAFPAGILQPPMFSADWPRAANFGAIGSVMGHEISHGFDDEGRKYDGAGQLVDWWPEDVVDRFEDRATCVQEQYDGFEVLEGVHVNGELTLGENIADLGGVRTAYRAYRNWSEANGPEAPLGDLTPDQVFFVSMAQAWCTKASDELMRVRVQTDPHAPPRFRVNGPLSNLPEFAEVFACEEGDPMVRADACEVW